jgi:hypothetical protein
MWPKKRMDSNRPEDVGGSDHEEQKQGSNYTMKKTNRRAGENHGSSEGS